MTDPSVTMAIEVIDCLFSERGLDQHLKKIPVVEQQRIIDSMTKGVLQTEHPKLIHMAGIPGSGKSTQALQLMQSEQSIAAGMVYISFDQIMEALEGYQAVLNRVDAFQQWELPARALGYQLLRFCLQENVSLLLDHSAADESHRLLLRALREKSDYHLMMYFMDATPEMVLHRIAKREQTTGRHTPSSIVSERYHILKGAIPQYQKIVHSFVHTMVEIAN